MFEATRKRLVKDYTFMLGAILTSTIVLLYLFFVFSIYYQQRELVDVFAYEETEEWYSALKYLPDIMPDKQGDNDDKSNNLFYYAYGAAGQCIGLHNKLSDKLVLHVEKTITEGKINNGEIKLKLFFHGDFRYFSAYMITKREIYDAGEKIGELYAGKDVLIYLEFVLKIFLFFIIFIIFTLAGSVYMAKKMADKAMIPIQQTFQRQRDFTADASHELRTPLSVILASVETIERNKNNILTEFSQSVLLDLKQEIQYMRKITEDLLTLARMDNQQKRTAKKELVLINELLTQICRAFQPLADEKTIQIVIKAEEECLVMADSNQLFQVLSILLDNAIKYTIQNGHICLSAVREKENQIKICVADDGCGIAPEDCAKIFERFYRVDKARSRQSGGTGLGLSIAQELVKINGGTIYVESELARGSSFIMVFPYLVTEYNIKK